MTTRTIRLRPEECCSVLTEPPALADDERERLLRAFKALADGTRLRIFQLIAAQHEPLCACDIVDRFDVSQPTIAHHLRTLREAGLITTSRQGGLGLLRPSIPPAWAGWPGCSRTSPVWPRLEALTG